MEGAAPPVNGGQAVFLSRVDVTTSMRRPAEPRPAWNDRENMVKAGSEERAVAEDEEADEETEEAADEDRSR